MVSKEVKPQYKDYTGGGETLTLRLHDIIIFTVVTNNEELQ